MNEEKHVSDNTSQKKPAQVDSTCIGLAEGLCLGVLFGVAIDNIGLGMLIGVAVGLCGGTAMDKLKKKKVENPKDDDEKQP